MKKTIINFASILWTSIGALVSLMLIYPLVISLIKYDSLKHRNSLLEVLISTYEDLSFQIHFDNLLMVLLFLSAGGLIGYLLYRSITSLDKKDKNLSLEELLEKGESEAIEYKSSLRWDYRQNKTSKELEFSVLKTIAAFMNTRKGTLLIGVADDGAIVGLENDYQSLKKKNRDGFEQHLMELVALSIGTDCCKNIRVTFFERHDKDICTVEVSHIKTPVFLKFLQGTFFYVRTGNHTRELDIQEALKCIKTHNIN